MGKTDRKSQYTHVFGNSVPTFYCGTGWRSLVPRPSRGGRERRPGNEAGLKGTEKSPNNRLGERKRCGLATANPDWGERRDR